MKKLFVLFLLFVALTQAGWCVGDSTQTLAEVSNYPKFFAYAAVSNSFATGLATFTTVLYDTHGGYDGNATYTIPIAGWYDLSANNQLYKTSGGYAYCFFKKNGAVLIATMNTVSVWATGANDARVHFPAVYLVAGDKITVYIESDATASNISGVSGAIQNFFCVKRIP